MTRFITLLFLSFLSTCVSAQNETVNPSTSLELPTGSGTLVVEFGDGTWDLSLSSTSHYEKTRYVTEGLFRSNPVRFADYTIVPGRDRYDLRMVHELIGRLAGEGWQLLTTNHSNSQSVDTWNTIQRTETILYQFSVQETAPAMPTTDPALQATVNTLRVVVSNRDRLRLRGAMRELEDGTFILEMEEMADGKWQTSYTLWGEGMLSTNAARQIKAIRAIEGKFTFQIVKPEGSYNYNFARRGEQDFHFAGVHFTSNETCGVLQYTLSMLQTVNGQLNGFYRPSPCIADDKPQAFSGSYLLGRTWLSEFEPGAQRIDLEEVSRVLNY